MQEYPTTSRAFILKFRRIVIKWFRANGRNFPWRHKSNPYHLILAESLLRQTQANRVVEPYLKLVKMYPDIKSLANASLKDLRILFQPLGLFSRADRLIDTAKTIGINHAGKVPDNLHDLLNLPGLGIYSARAVLCLGFGRPEPLIDEGSGRVLRRVFGYISTSPAYSDRQLLQKAKEILPPRTSREFNLGLLDIAAAYCHVQNPVCIKCPLQNICLYIKAKA